MTIIELKDQIVKNQLSNFYIFTGDEIGIINIYLQQMSNKLNIPIIRADSVASIYSKCTARSMFGTQIGMYVIRGDKDFQKEEKVWETISEDIKKNVIVLLYDKLDSRLKFGKHFKDNTVQFDKLTPNVLKSYIAREIALTNDNIDTLMELCNYSYDMCMLEIDKIKQFHSVFTSNGYDDCFTRLLDNGVIYQPEESDVFKFVDSVCNRKQITSFKLEEILRNNNTSSIVLLGSLYNALKSIMLIQCCEGSNVSEITGLDNRQVYFDKKYVGKYSTTDLVSGVKLISEVIDGIKSGWIEDVYATRYVLSMLF